MNGGFDLRKSAGFAPVYRTLADHPIWHGESFTRGQAWVDLLMLVNYKDGQIMIDGTMIEVKKGQHVTSVMKLAERWKWSRAKVLRYFKMLKTEQMLDWESDNKKTVITLLNHDFWNSVCDDENTDSQLDGTHTNIKRTSNEHQTNIKRTSNEHQTDTNNKDNKDNKENKEKNPIAHADEENDVREAKPKKQPALKQWERRAKKSKGFQQFVSEYPEHRSLGQYRTFLAWERQGIDGDPELFEKTMKWLRSWVKSDDWTKDGGKYVPNMDKFMDQYWGRMPRQNQAGWKSNQGRPGTTVKEDHEYTTSGSAQMDLLAQKLREKQNAG